MSQNDDSNHKTLNSYDRRVQEYIEGTPQSVSGFVKNWIDKALSIINKNSTILELGSAFGRDFDYMESRGYHVIASDASRGFVEYLQKQGKQARLLNAINDDLGGLYDMVFANAVFLHFNSNEFTKVLLKIHQSLKKDGTLAFSVKQGKGTEWSKEKLDAPRFFCYWQIAGLKKVLKDTNFTIIELSESPDKKWLHVISKKSQEDK